MKQTKEQFVGVTYDGLLAENAALRTQLADVTESMGRVEERCARLRALCRDMYLVVELLDMDGMRLQAHGKDADWRTLKERFHELGEVDG
jgi:hypothetical protein